MASMHQQTSCRKWSRLALPFMVLSLAGCDQLLNQNTTPTITVRARDWLTAQGIDIYDNQLVGSHRLREEENWQPMNSHSLGMILGYVSCCSVKKIPGRSGPVACLPPPVHLVRVSNASGEVVLTIGIGLEASYIETQEGNEGRLARWFPSEEVRISLERAVAENFEQPAQLTTPIERQQP
ncbi:hypothetical protein Pan181_44890 [Aeoliella mucimassa]|uniref:Uncharacterized protein n=1 Tax=Aeoliella mucimassa TaxID=2527972 RepID=A0A518AU79_9BACT|nr:hypothetical protein Pan181_44890 [Aeoliella mucimassa]